MAWPEPHTPESTPSHTAKTGNTKPHTHIQTPARRAHTNPRQRPHQQLAANNPHIPGPPGGEGDTHITKHQHKHTQQLMQQGYPHRTRANTNTEGTTRGNTNNTPHTTTCRHERHTQQTHAEHNHPTPPRTPTTASSILQPGVARICTPGPQPGLAGDDQPPPAQTPAKNGGELQPRPSTRNREGPHAKTNSRLQPGMAGHCTQDPQPGVARDRPPTPTADPSQEWRGTAPRALSQDGQRPTHYTHRKPLTHRGHTRHAHTDTHTEVSIKGTTNSRLKRLGGGQPPIFPWHARPQSHEIQYFLSNLGFSKKFCDPCLSHDTIWRPRQEMKVYVDKENM